MKPILFNTEMVRAILDGRKTVTRRIVKPQPEERLAKGDNALESLAAACAPYRPGDILYVRETWTIIGTDGAHHKYGYKADKEYGALWRPSIHMPKEAARLFLRVTNVRVERLQEITEDGARAEGCASHGGNLAVDEFITVWQRTIKAADLSRRGWEDNPWVWVIEFERISKEEAEKGDVGNG